MGLMADNYNINEATSGTLTAIAADEVGAVKVTRVKVTHGVDGSMSDASQSAPLPVGLVPMASGGLTSYHLKAAATTNTNSVKASAGQLYGGVAFNSSGSTKFLKLYDKASAPVLASDVPKFVFPLKAGESTPISFGGHGAAFGTGIALAITGAVGDADTTALSANDVILNLGYM
jgi:hypothetical protein